MSKSAILTLLYFALLLPVPARARIIPIPSGTGQMDRVLPSLAPGDTLMLTTNGASITNPTQWTCQPSP